ncbi:MAG: CAP domain-containing protein, partial [Chloroflexota bacterium]
MVGNYTISHNKAEAVINCPYQTNPSYEARVLELINIERAKVGLPALLSQSQLATAARLHSADMACNNFFSHTGSDGASLSERVERQGYSWLYLGENIAAGYPTPESVVDAWMNSSGHRANILNANYTEIGIGYAYWYDSTYGAYWTTDFGKPFVQTISGNAGASGVTLSYTDGTAKTVTSQPNGDYSLSVTPGWSGTVTPSHPCYTFTPASRTYTNVTANQTGQNYTATFNSSSG